MFIDLVKITIVSGNGGNGVVAFRREKHVPLGGPSGGDGGRGGDIIFKADPNKATLLDLRFHKRIVAENGGNGKTKKMHGANGSDVIVKVPLGTILKDSISGIVLADLTRVNQQEIVLSGGKGGFGNHHFASSRNSAPEFSEKGENGKARDITVELKVLADCGLIGLPSVGKSTILSVVSKARPEIADYPFTTLAPNLGLVEIYDQTFVMADLPGLIEDAHIGKGLGIQFLKHIERCRVLVHVLDMSRESPIDDFETINAELEFYNINLLQRPMIIVANKMDADNAEENLGKLRLKYPSQPIYPIIALINEGITPLLVKIAEFLATNIEVVDVVRTDEEVVYKYTAPEQIKITKEGEGRFRVSGYDIERLVERNDLNNEASLLRVIRKFKAFDLDKKLRLAGVKHGDTVIILDFVFDFIEE